MEFMPVMEYFLITKVKKGETFVTKKITKGLSLIDVGLQGAFTWATRMLNGIGAC